MSKRPSRPRFTGVRTHIDPLGRFTHRYPTGWHSFELEDNRDGTMYSPSATNPQTYFAVWSTKMEDSVVVEDFDDLLMGITEGLNSLPGFKLMESGNDFFGNLMKFDRVFTFEDNGVRRKRHVWLLYVDIWQIVVTFQGETPEEYHYWLPMGNYCFNSFNLAQELWFATDRELNGMAKVQK
jgi:hypothetical protein